MPNGFAALQASFFPHPLHWTACGPLSLHHAALMVGEPVDRDDILRLRSLWQIVGGIDRKPLMTIARRNGLAPTDLTSPGPRSLRRRIDAALTRGRSVVIGSDPHCHWMVLGGKYGRGQYIWIDSADEDLFGIWHWDDVEGWLVGDDEDEEQEEFEAFSIASKRDPGCRHSMVPHLDGIWEPLRSSTDLAAYWGDYLEELRWAFDDLDGGPRMPAEGFIRSNLDAIADPVLWTDDDDAMEQASIRGMLENFAMVADFHSLTVARKQEKTAVALMALIVQRGYYEYP